MDNLQLSQGGNLVFGSAGLTSGTNAGTLQIGNTIAYTIDGLFYSKAAANNIAFNFTPVAPDIYRQDGVSEGTFTGRAGGSVRLYGVFLDTAGVVSTRGGEVESVTSLAEGSTSLQYPAPVKGLTCIGFVRVQVTQNTTFVPGTTALNAAGVTTTFLNSCGIPGEPIRS